MAGPSLPWPHDCSASMPTMEYSMAATPPRPAMENSKYTIPRSRRISNNELPLVHCKDRNCRFLKAYTVKTEKNYGHQFYVCPTRTWEGAGCPFWEWEEGYEQYLLTINWCLQIINLFSSLLSCRRKSQLSKTSRTVENQARKNKLSSLGR